MFGLGGQELVLVLLIVILYFIPSLIAVSRHHRNKTAIFVLNIFLGWSVLGWVVALVWSFTNDRGAS